jgi:hypothetical protein
MADERAGARRANRRRVVGHHVIWAVSAVGAVIAAWATTGTIGEAAFWAPCAVGIGFGAAGTTWAVTAGEVTREVRPRGTPHPRSRRARGETAPRELAPPWRWPMVLAYAVPVPVAMVVAPYARGAEDPHVLAAVQPFAVLIGWLCGLLVFLFVQLFRLVLAGVVGFGRPLATGEVEGEDVPRAWFVGPFVGTASLLALPLVLVGPLAYDSPYRRDVLPLLGVVRDGVDVDHPILLGMSQVATWAIVLGLLAGWLTHRTVGARAVASYRE